MSVSYAPSPRPTSVASCQTSSPRFPSPLNPSPSFSSHHTSHNSPTPPIDEMSDTLSPLREHPDSGPISSPRSPPLVTRPRTSSFSRSPEGSPVLGAIPLRGFTRHSSPSSSPLAQGVAFSGSSPHPSSPLVGSPQFPVSHNPRLLSPSNSSRPGSPTSIHNIHSQFQPLYSPSQSQSHFNFSKSSPIQVLHSSPCHCTRTQSAVLCGMQFASSPPDHLRSRRVSLGTESRPHLSMRANSIPGDSSYTNMHSLVNSTPLNEAPVRWWGGQSGWVNDWDHVSQQSYGMRYPLFADALTVGGRDSGAFRDEEIRSSFDCIMSMGTNSVGMLGKGTGCGTDGMPALYSDAGGGIPPLEETSHVQKMPNDHLGHHYACHVYSHPNTGFYALDAALALQGRESNHDGRGRRCSDASTHSSASYFSCLSGISQSQSQSLVSPSQSHTSHSPSLHSLGIGIEEAEREVLRAKTMWRRRNSSSAAKRCGKRLSRGNGEVVDQGCQSSKLVGGGGELVGAGKGEVASLSNTDPKHFAIQKEPAKHGYLFSRGGSKHGDALDEQVQQEGYNRAEKYVSLAIASILPAAAIATMSPVGESLVKVRDSAKYVGQELAPVVKDTLSLSANLLASAPLPGLEEAAKALLYIWDACQKVDTNRLSCLRLAERCATLLYSVRCEINEAGMETALALSEPVDQLCGALLQIRTFLETQLHRPFLKRYLRREEIARELVACNEAITDAASKFGISVQIRTYHEVCSVVNESKRYAMEIQALLSFDVQMMQRHYAMMYGRQTRPEAASLPSTNTLGLTLGDVPIRPNGFPVRTINHDDASGEFLVPSSVCGPLLPSTTAIGLESEQNTPTSSTFDGTNSISTPTPTGATFVAEEKRITAAKTSTLPASPIHALTQVHRAQDTVDAAADDATLRGTLEGALEAENDVEMVRCLQVARGEISEAAETLRRTLGAASNACECPVEGGEHATDERNTELDRKFMQSGIEAMTRLTKGEETFAVAGAVGTSQLPDWTITRYEVIRTRKIGVGFFSSVYLGHWRKLQVVVKVLAHSVSKETFVRHVELWNTLDHPNVLPLYGASSAVGDKPWFFVSKFCGKGNLGTLLKQARTDGTMMGEKVDLLRSMTEIAKGMAYLHGCGVLHGDLRAANVLVDEHGQCVLSDFGQCEIKLEAHQLAGKPESHPIQWRAPEMLIGNVQPTCATDAYAFATCCVEILGMGDIPWKMLDDKVIRELILDKDERPYIPAPVGYAEVASAINALLHSCWVREPDCRPPFTSIVSLLEGLCKVRGLDHERPQRASTPVVCDETMYVASTESSPADGQYETASESSMTKEIEEDVPPILVSVHDDVFRSVVHADGHTELGISTRVSSNVPGQEETDTPTMSPTSTLVGDAGQEEYYRVTMGSSHAFHESLTLPLWSPTRVDIGAVGYLSKPKGKFITLFNAIDPLQSCEERLRRLPSMYGYGMFEVLKREDGKRNAAQRGLDAISGFLTFKTRCERSHSERIARQYTFPLVQGKPSAHLCVEKTVHRFVDQLDAPTTWFKQHVDLILGVLGPRYGIQREELILVVGTLEAPDWALFFSKDHFTGRAQFNVFSSRERGEPWGMYTVEQAVKGGNGGTLWVDAGKGTFSSKVSCATAGYHDGVGDTIMLSGLRFERGMGIPMIT